MFTSEKENPANEMGAPVEASLIPLDVHAPLENELSVSVTVYQTWSFIPHC